MRQELLIIIQDYAERIIKYENDHSINSKYYQDYFWKALQSHIQNYRQEGGYLPVKIQKLVNKALIIWQKNCQNQDCSFKSPSLPIITL